MKTYANRSAGVVARLSVSGSRTRSFLPGQSFSDASYARVSGSWDNSVAAAQPARTLDGGVIQRGPAKKVVGWIVKVGERRLIKKTTIYTEKQMESLLAKGYNVLVKDGRKTAEQIAERVWGKDYVRHGGHYIKKAREFGKPHFQPRQHLVGRPGEKGWHIFYSSAMAVLLFDERVEAQAIYEDKYPGPSVANALTFTYHFGEESPLSYVDWINPLELVALGGDIGRAIDRELNKDLRFIVFNTESANGTKLSYVFEPNGQLDSVIVATPKGKAQTIPADKYFVMLEKGEMKAPSAIRHAGPKSSSRP